MFQRRTCFAAALLAMILTGAPATADVTIWLDAQDTEIPTVGGDAEVELWANFSDPVVAWGLDLTLSTPAVADLTGILTDVSWDPTDTLDDDGLAGLRFATGLSGDVLLATLTFTGTSVGMTDVTLGYDQEDEGLLLEAGGLDAAVSYGPGTITVLPEPTALSLLASGGLLVIGRRR